MSTLLQVLSKDDRAQVHERTLSILGSTGVRVDTSRGRDILREWGADVDGEMGMVRFPRRLVEEALRLAPREFSLGARRPGWDLTMNAGDCTLLADGEALYALDSETWARRPATVTDWRDATRLIDALDEIGIYWSMVDGTGGGDTVADMLKYWRTLFRSFSKHVQDPILKPKYAPWLIEVLQVVFGDRRTIRREHPLSFLLCPQSPLVIEEEPTDAYLALLGWDIPVAVMPMPLMGTTAPGSLISTTVLGNCEVLAMLCLVQAASPGTPFIYAPALSVMDPHSGRYASGAIEGGLLSAAATEMGRYYGLPVETSGMGTDQHVPSIQGGYERAMNGLLPMLAWPDILVGPGLLGGSMILSLEQTLLDVEVFRMCKRAHRGIVTEAHRWLEDVINAAERGGHFLGERSTVRGLREGEWYISQLGVHDTFGSWDAAGRPSLIEEARGKVTQILATHEPLPLDDDVERELDRIEKRAREIAAAS
jgi:trimethylamine--corrinoid protein Co-methyltransferase